MRPYSFKSKVTIGCCSTLTYKKEEKKINSENMINDRYGSCQLATTTK